MFDLNFWHAPSNQNGLHSKHDPFLNVSTCKGLWIYLLPASWYCSTWPILFLFHAFSKKMEPGMGMLPPPMLDGWLCEFDYWFSTHVYHSRLLCKCLSSFRRFLSHITSQTVDAAATCSASHVDKDITAYFSKSNKKLLNQDKRHI